MRVFKFEKSGDNIEKRLIEEGQREYKERF